MEKTSKITKSEFSKQWSPPQGVTLYIHAVVFDNGDAGNFYHPKQNPPDISVGKTVTYTMNDKSKITIIKEQSENSEMTKKATYSPKQVDVIGLAFSYAKDILVAHINAGLCVTKTKDVYKDLFLIAEPINEKMIAMRDAVINAEKEKTE